MGLQKWFSRTFKVRAPVSLPRAALIDTSNDTLITLGTTHTHMILLSEMMLDTVHVANIQRSRELESLMYASSSTYPEWSYHRTERTFKPTRRELISEDMRVRAVLAASKRDAIVIALRYINSARMRWHKDLLFQETIYAAKEIQARRLRDARYDEATIEIPYIIQHAELNNISLRDAADDILLRSQLFHEYLLKTEHARTVLFKKIRHASSSKELTHILEDFKNNRVL